MGAQGNPDTIDEMPTEGGPALSDYRYERVLLKLSGEALMETAVTVSIRA